jgi:hypothetical protein
MEITILGTAKTNDNDFIGQVWGMPYDHDKADVIFETHRPDHCGIGIDNLKKINKPIFFLPRWQKKYRKLGIKGTEIPIEEMTEYFGREYFTSSMAYMMALAIMQDPKRIKISKVCMSIDTEYYFQRACLEYYIGFANGHGIEVIIDQESEILFSTHLYGDDPPVEMQRIKSALKAKAQERDEVKGLMDQNNQKLSYLTGKIETLKIYGENTEAMETEYRELYQIVEYQKALYHQLNGTIKTHSFYKRLFST